jgi:hypothetical protein
VFHLGGHGQDDRPQGVAGSADRVGSLLGVATLPALPARRTGAGVDVELGDDRHDGGQVSLVLDDLVQLVEGNVAERAFVQWDVDDAVDLVRGRHGPQVGDVSFAASRLFGFVGAFRPTEGMGLAMGVALGLVELLT